MPCPSEPITNTVGESYIPSRYSLASFISVPTTQYPSCFKFLSVCDKFVTMETGTVYAAPVLAFTTVGVKPQLLCFVKITPSTPAQSQVLKIAPTLCGSCIPSNATRRPGFFARDTICSILYVSISLTLTATPL